MRYRALVLATLCLIAAHVGLAAEHTGADSAGADKISKDLDAYVQAEMTRRHIPGLALAVIQGQQLRKMSTYGYASVEYSVPVQPATVFHLASISKVFTSVAVMVLVDSGKLNLDDRIGKYLDGLPPKWQSISIRRLLSHTSGLPDFLTNPEVSLATVADTPQGTLKALRSRPMDFEPGSRWQYNQTNYMLLSMLIEKLSGQSFAQFCKSHLFAPLSLESAVFADQRAVVANRATEYTRLDLTNEANPMLDHAELLDYRMAPILYPGGGMNISVADFSRWLMALTAGKLISKQSLETLWMPAQLKDGKSVDGLEYPAPWTSYGLGWMLNPHGNHPQAGHMGGARTSMAVFPKDDLAVIVLTNLQGDEPDSLLTEIANRYLAVRQH